MTIAEELRELEALRASGTLSDTEFAQAKQQVLDGVDELPSYDGERKLYGLNETTWCTLMHLSQLLWFTAAGIVAPILMWVISKDESELARRHGARMMNWLLSVLIYSVVSSLLIVILIGIPMLVVVLILNIVFPIMAGMKSNDGELWSYPLAIRFLPED